jgi:hypothetical protein
MSCPNSSTRPELGGKSPQIRLNSVVLPAPFGPSTARRSPAATGERDVAHRGERPEAAPDAMQRERRGA